MRTPSKAERISFACATGSILPDRPVLDSRFENPFQPHEMLLKKPRYSLPEPLRQDVAFAGHYAAKTPLILSEPIKIKPCLLGR